MSVTNGATAKASKVAAPSYTVSVADVYTATVRAKTAAKAG